MSSGLEIFTVEQTRAADAAAIAAGTSGFALMQRAGEGAARAIAARWDAPRTVVLCGPGNNGGDGYVIAHALAERGWSVSVAADADHPPMGDAAEAAKGWRARIAPLTPEVLKRAELVVDALFGAGLRRPLSPALQVLLKVAETRAPIVAIDLPSGLDGDTGAPLDYAPNATLTVTFHRKKPAHVLEPGKSLCGEVEIIDIGLPSPEDASLWENAPALWADRFPWPKTDGHKSQRGHLMVVSGDLSHTGAARLASRAGLRAGAGLVTLLSPPNALLSNTTHLEAVMVAPFANADALVEAVEKANAVVIGPAAGVGEATRDHLLGLAQAHKALVVDADALTSFKADPDTIFAALTPADVMTPHPGEFDRVFPGLLTESPTRIAAAQAAAVRAGCVVLLKGPDTVVAAPDGRAVVNTNAAPWLATAGSGDVLAGIIGGLLAQGMNAFDAACAGAWLHAAAGASFGPGLISEDLPDRLAPVLARLYHERPAGTVEKRSR